MDADEGERSDRVRGACKGPASASAADTRRWVWRAMRTFPGPLARKQIRLARGRGRAARRGGREARPHGSRIRSGVEGGADDRRPGRRRACRGRPSCRGALVSRRLRGGWARPCRMTLLLVGRSDSATDPTIARRSSSYRRSAGSPRTAPRACAGRRAARSVRSLRSAPDARDRRATRRTRRPNPGRCSRPPPPSARGSSDRTTPSTRAPSSSWTIHRWRCSFEEPAWTCRSGGWRSLARAGARRSGVRSRMTSGAGWPRRAYASSAAPPTGSMRRRTQRALDAGGRTIAVLGSGIDVRYPRSSAGLIDRCRSPERLRRQRVRAGGAGRTSSVPGAQPHRGRAGVRPRRGGGSGAERIADLRRPRARSRARRVRGAGPGDEPAGGGTPRPDPRRSHDDPWRGRPARGPRGGRGRSRRGAADRAPRPRASRVVRARGTFAARRGRAQGRAAIHPRSRRRADPARAPRPRPQCRRPIRTNARGCPRGREVFEPSGGR